MDYTERIDNIIEQFAGETSSLMSRISDVKAELDYIEEHIFSVKKTLTDYAKNVHESEYRLYTAAEIFEDLDAAVANITAKIDLICNTQQGYTQTFKDKAIQDEKNNNNITQVYHVAADAVSKINDVSEEIKEVKNSFSDKLLLTTSKLSDINSNLDTAINATARIFEKCEVLQDILVLRFESISRELEEEKKKTEENNKQTQELLHQILSRLTDIETSLPAKKKAFFGK